MVAKLVSPTATLELNLFQMVPCDRSFRDAVAIESALMKNVNDRVIRSSGLRADVAETAFGFQQAGRRTLEG